MVGQADRRTILVTSLLVLGGLIALYSASAPFSLRHLGSDTSMVLRQAVAAVVGVGAVKYALVSVEPIKTVSFTWDRVLDFERNSAPFIQYAHARCCNILKKAGEMPSEAYPSLLSNSLERALLLKVARYPETVADAADSLRPNAVAEYANATADQLNTFYAALPVIRADTEDLRAARLHLVNSVRIVLRNALGLLGIDAPERM